MYVLAKVTLDAMTNKSGNITGLNYCKFITYSHKVLSGVVSTDYTQPFRLIEAHGKKERKII